LPEGDVQGKGQDGYVQAGKKWSHQHRFTDNGDYTVTDNLTNLVWLKNADRFGERRWEDALRLAHHLHSGCRDCPELADRSTANQWRLPNVRELLSLIDYGTKAHPVLPRDHPFGNARSGKYWTSTSLEPAAQLAWMMTLGLGPTVFDIKDKHNKTRLWPVRDGAGDSRVLRTGQVHCFDEHGKRLPADHPLSVGQDGWWKKGKQVHGPRFASDVDGGGTVTDRLTGLVWLKNANPFTDPKTNPFGFLTWQKAVEVCLKVARGKYGLQDDSHEGDWRLPNIREIESLVDYGQFGPCLPDHGQPWFENVRPSSYWTSTTVTDAPSEAMFIILGVGPSIFENKEHAFFAWPVRDRLHR